MFEFMPLSNNIYLLEVGCGDVDSAIAAYRAGAGRIELFANMPEGGTTPSAGTLHTVLDNVNIPVMVMIRPRGGDFSYSDDEFQSMCHDVKMVKNTGAAGIVIGCLKAGGDIDMDKCARLVELASPLEVTFHRAFDLTPDLFASLEVLLSLGIRRVLTTGGKTTAMEGKETIRQLRQLAGTRITVMPGGGVRALILQSLASETGCTEFHMAPIKKRNTLLSHSPCPEAFCSTTLTDTEEISKAALIIRNL